MNLTSLTQKYRTFNLIYLLIVMIVSSSCEKEFIEIDENQGKTDESTGTFTQKNGRLYFPSEEIFRQEYKKLQGKDDDEMYELAAEMHGRNFIPLRPIITEENEEIVFKQLKIRNEELKKRVEEKGSSPVSDTYVLDHIDDLEDIIGDDAFSNFLNTKAEVQIGNDIYKYTDVGLFIAKETAYKRLENYLEVREISDNLLIPTSHESKKRLFDDIPQGGYTSLDDNITYFRAPLEVQPEYIQPIDPGNGGGGGGLPPAPKPTPAQTLENFLRNLDDCSPSRGLFGKVFGTNQVCIDKYESNRRVKTKAFNYNYGVAFHTGVKVKHQKKGWTGIWRKEEVDEIVMGVEYAVFEYNFMPIFTQALKNLDLNQSFISPLTAGRTSGVYHVTTSLYGGTAVIDHTYLRHNPYPYELFESDLIIETWSHNDMWDKIVNENINELTKSEKLNKYFWENIWSNTKSQVSKLVKDPKDPGAPEYKMPDDMIHASKHPTIGKVLIFQTLNRRRSNNDKIEKTFDWGIGINLALNSANNYSLLQGNVGAPNLQRPQNYHVKLYGAVKRNGKWHGSKFKF